MFQNKVQGGGISTPSIQQASTINPIAGALQSAAGWLDAFTPPAPSQSAVTEGLKTEGLKLAGQDLAEASSIIDPDERRRFLNKKRIERNASGMTATSLDAYNSSLQQQFGDTDLKVQEELFVARERALAERETEMFTMGFDTLVGMGVDPNTITEEQALSFGIRQQGRNTYLQQQAAEYTARSNARTEEDAVRSAQAQVAFDGYLYDTNTRVDATLAKYQTQLADPSTRMQATTSLVAELELIKGRLQLEAGASVRAAGGRLSDVDFNRINSINAVIDTYKNVITGSTDTDTIDALVNNYGAQVFLHQLNSDPKGSFTNTAALSYFGQRKIGPGAVMAGAQAQGSLKDFSPQNPARTIKIAGMVDQGTPPANRDEAPAFWNMVGSGIKSVVSMSNPNTALLTTAADTIVNALASSTIGLPSVVNTNHAADALPSLQRDTALLNGPALPALQQAVSEKLEREGVDPVELAVRDADITFRTKILPLFRTWDFEQALARTELSSSGGKLRINFSADVDSSNPAIRSVARSTFFNSTQAQSEISISKDLRVAERKLNEMISSMANLTGQDRDAIATAVAAHYKAMVEMEKLKLGK